MKETIASLALLAALGAQAQTYTVTDQVSQTTSTVMMDSDGDGVAEVYEVRQVYDVIGDDLVANLEDSGVYKSDINFAFGTNVMPGWVVSFEVVDSNANGRPDLLAMVLDDFDPASEAEARWVAEQASSPQDLLPGGFSSPTISYLWDPATPGQGSGGDGQGSGGDRGNATITVNSDSPDPVFHGWSQVFTRAIVETCDGASIDPAVHAMYCAATLTATVWIAPLGPAGNYWNGPAMVEPCDDQGCRSRDGKWFTQ